MIGLLNKRIQAHKLSVSEKISESLTENHAKIRIFLYTLPFLIEYGADMKRLLIINNQDSFTYNLVDLIRRLDVPFDVINVQELDLDAVANYSHILI